MWDNSDENIKYLDEKIVDRILEFIFDMAEFWFILLPILIIFIYYLCTLIQVN